MNLARAHEAMFIFMFFIALIAGATVEEIEDWLTRVNAKEMEFLKPVNEEPTTSEVENASDEIPEQNYDYKDYSNYEDVDFNFEDLVFESHYDEWHANVTHEAAKLLKENKESLLKKNRTALRLLQLYALEGALLHPVQKDRVCHTHHEKKFLEAIKSESEICPERPRAYKLALKSDDITSLKCIWESWHDEVGSAIREDFIEVVKLSNVAARENGYSDASEVWKLQDAENKNAEAEMKRLLRNIMPIYRQLHSYVRRKLFDKHYNSCGQKLNVTDPIPAHLTGNLIGQEWTELEDLVIPYPESPSLNFTRLMKERNLNQTHMAKEAEKFFASLGFRKMTKTFWKNSNFSLSEDNELGCHPRAQDDVNNDDYRIYMCADLNLVDYGVLHHEMGHVVTFMECQNLPYKFRSGMSKIFGEGFGDSMALSATTPDHLKKAFDLKEPPAILKSSIEKKRDINALMRSALYVLPLIPYSYILDIWRYKVFQSIKPEDYNNRWWKLRKMYQGIVPPTPRSDDKFDPGAILHVAVNVPYAKYFFSLFVEFQLHKSLCKLSGHKGPLHHCDIYKSAKAGKKLRASLKKGGSVTTAELLLELTGSREYSALPILEYYKPLHRWLKKQNKGYHVGWNI